MAELSPVEKNEISHRAVAARKLRARLQEVAANFDEH
jgi:inosine/xanthosine triphosphate pyrophosphatase family protein